MLFRSFQREDAVNITWKLRETQVNKRQVLYILKASRQEVMDVLNALPEEMELINLKVLASYSTLHPSWEMIFSVPDLHVLSRVLRYFDRSAIPFEYYLES